MTAADILAAYYRCPAGPGGLVSPADLDGQCGYFRFGADTVCYGRLSGGVPGERPNEASVDALEAVRADGQAARLPFDAGEVIDNLRMERYAGSWSAGRPARHEAFRRAYYYLRPALPVAIRRFLHKQYFRGWEELGFPAWPVDTTVERLHRRLLALTLQASGAAETPFIWFWPEGFQSCCVMTHDVETQAGLDACEWLMDLDEGFGMRSALVLIPERRYPLRPDMVRELLERGCEISIHDLNHDGNLFACREEFLRRVKRINYYGRLYGAKGFRSGAMYRNAEWYGNLEFAYDMSIPNVAHLEPQRGGCCTVMPYFIGDVLELPTTMTQDYTLFHVLGDYSIGLWKRQLGLMIEESGLANFNVHPDYLTSERATGTYKSLLIYLAELRAARKMWFALPGEVDTWWRQRSQMRLVVKEGGWRVEGAGSERARIAIAAVEGDTVRYSVA